MFFCFHRVPPGTWQQLFPGKLRPCHLTALDIALNSPLEGPDLDQLASSCRGLQKLYLCCSPGLQLTALLRLTALTQLCLRGVTDAITLASLSCLSRLHGLEALALIDPCWIQDDTLVAAAALTQLKLLALPSTGAISTTMQQQLQLVHQCLGRGDNPFSGLGWFLTIKNTASASRRLCGLSFGGT